VRWREALGIRPPAPGRGRTRVEIPGFLLEAWRGGELRVVGSWRPLGQRRNETAAVVVLKHTRAVPNPDQGRGISAGGGWVGA
jgi:hypothetical protein